MELEHFISILSKIKEKEALQGNIFGDFSPRYSQNYILNGKFNLMMNTIWVFFPKSRHFFDFQKGKRGLPSLVRVAEYVSISLNMPQYPWKCLNKLF